MKRLALRVLSGTYKLLRVQSVEEGCCWSGSGENEMGECVCWVLAVCGFLCWVRMDGADQSLKRSNSQAQSLSISLYMALSCNAWGLRSRLCSTFFGPDVECNLVSSWLNPAFCQHWSSDRKARICYDRQDSCQSTTSIGAFVGLVQSSWALRSRCWSRSGWS